MEQIWKGYGINHILLPLSIASFIFFQELFCHLKFKTGRTLRRENCIILTPKLNLSTEEYKAGHPLHNKSFIDFTDLIRSVKLIFFQNI